MDPNFLRVNNTVYSWNSSRFQVGPLPYVGFIGVDYEVVRERKIVYAARPDGTPLGWTTGRYQVKSLKLRMLQETALAFKADAATILGGLGSYGDAEFPIMIQTVEQAVQAVGLLPSTKNFHPCTIIGEREAREEGIENLVVEFDLACLHMDENGLTMASLQRAV